MIYLDNSATSKFKPKCMFDAMFSQLTDSANAGRGGHNDSIDCAIKIADTRDSLKKICGATQNYHLVFTSGCTEALNLAILGYADNLKGGNVITTVREHNSVLRPLNHLLEKQIINEIKYCHPDENGNITDKEIERLIDKNTRLIVVNHMSNVTGEMIDLQKLGELASKNNIPLLTDAAQSLGHKKIDMQKMKITMLAGAGHKGLHGSQGTGFLIFSKDIFLSPIRYGGTGTFSESLTQPTTAPEGFESGTLNTAGIIGLGAAAKWTYSNFEQINRHIAYLSSQFIYGLSKIPKVELYTKSVSGVISFNIQGYDSTEVADFLNDNDIAVRSGLHCAPLMHKYLGTLERGTVRASIGYNNNSYHINRTLDVIEKFCSKQYH